MVTPAVSDRLDYEGELAVVIGKPCHKVSRADAMAHVVGYAVFNDGSVRDWQRHNIQFTPRQDLSRHRCAGAVQGIV